MSSVFVAYDLITHGTDAYFKTTGNNVGFGSGFYVLDIF